MKDWIKYSIDTPVRIVGNNNGHSLDEVDDFTIEISDVLSFCEEKGFAYCLSEDKLKCTIRSCDLDPVNPNDYYKYLKKGDYVVCIENTSGLAYRKINTVYQITKDSAYQDCVYFEKDLNSSKVKDFRLATYSEIEKCKANNNKPTSLDEEDIVILPSSKYSEQFFVKITKEFTRELCDATEKWLVENSIAPEVKHYGELEEYIEEIGSFDNYYCSHYYHGIDNNTQSIQKELSILELKTLIGYSEPIKEPVTKEDWKHGWYKIDDNYLHYSGNKRKCYGFYIGSWGNYYIIDSALKQKSEFIDTPDEALTKLFFEKAAKDYPKSTKFFPVNHENLKGESIAYGHIRGNIIWWENSIYKKGEALSSQSGSGIFYYNGVWAKIESKPEVKENMETFEFKIGGWYKGTPNDFIKLSRLEKRKGYNQLYYTEKIENKKHEVKNDYWANSEFENYAKNNPVDLLEIQKFLPEGHPDKVSKYEYEVVHCKTQEEWDFVIDNFKTNVGTPLKKRYPENNCICVEGMDKGGYCTLNWFKSRNSLIYSFQEWCDKFNHVNPFIVKEESLLEEAKSRYPVGTKFWPAHLSERGNTKEFCIVSEKHEFKEVEKDIWLQVDHCVYNQSLDPEFGNCDYNYILYRRGKWAEIIDNKEPPKTYEFNKGDLVVVEQDFGDWIENGEIVRLGGEFWRDENIDYLNKNQSIAAISKKNPEGNAGGITPINFRKATEEEIAFYEKVGIGANIYQMKNPFPTEELKEKLVEIQKSPTIADKTNIKIGTKVIRGRDWSWGDQDGGEGNTGIVVEKGGYYPIDPKYTWVPVQWEGGERVLAYKIGFDDMYDLYLAPDEVSLLSIYKPRKMYKIGIDAATETKEKGGRSSLEVDLIID